MVNPALPCPPLNHVTNRLREVSCKIQTLFTPLKRKYPGLLSFNSLSGMPVYSPSKAATREGKEHEGLKHPLSLTRRLFHEENAEDFLIQPLQCRTCQEDFPTPPSLTPSKERPKPALRKIQSKGRVTGRLWRYRIKWLTVGSKQLLKGVQICFSFMVPIIYIPRLQRVV